MLVDPYTLPRRLFTNEAFRRAQVAVRVRDGVRTFSAPGMATAQAAHSQPGAPKKSVSFERLEKVSRTGRLKAASGTRPAQKRQHGRNEHLVSANQKTHEQ